MPNAITRNLYLCFSRLKVVSSSSSSTTTSTSSSSVPLDKTQNPDSVPSSSSSSSSSLFFANFNSLYDHTAVTSPDSEAAISPATSKPVTLITKATAAATATTTANSDDSNPTTPLYSPAYVTDLSSAMASRRLLPPSSPGRSNAIADPAAIAVGTGVAVPTYSTDPYGEFRRSMEEMAAAMGLLDQCNHRRRRERLHELLLCYLVLNRKHAHKYIIGAFADLLVAPTKSTAAVAAETQDAEEGDGR